MTELSVHTALLNRGATDPDPTNVRWFEPTDHRAGRRPKQRSMVMTRLDGSAPSPERPRPESSDWHLIASSRTGRSRTMRVWLTTIALLCGGAAITSVTERIAPLTDRCASKDAELSARISVLEQSGAPTHQIADTVADLIGARKACRSDEAGGLAFYNTALETASAPSIVSQK
jgi:hypothetical protein